jgi:hypothetical protein
MSRRIQIVLPDPLATQLDTLAAALQQRTATLAGQMVHDAIHHLTTPSRTPPPRQPAPPPANDGGRPAWLEPETDDPIWRQQMWSAILALYNRYPRQLQDLKTGWWNDHHHTEILAALATWRTQLDQTGHDPREEITFHNQLTHYTNTLHKQGGGITKTWKPNEESSEWPSG